MIIMKKALALIREKLLAVVKNLRDFADTYKSLPALAYTHLQPAQLTTVGKRACLWLYELTLDLHDLDYVSDSLALLGQKGTTGTQASFMELFGGDTEKIDKLEAMIAADFGFDKVVPVSGQTYSRKFDSRVMNVLSGIAQSAYKFANDMRILQSFKEMEEPLKKIKLFISHALQAQSDEKRAYLRACPICHCRFYQSCCHRIHTMVRAHAR